MVADEQSPDVVTEINRFCDKTLVSKRNNALLLGISPSTLVRWIDVTNATEPYDWTAQQVLRRIALFDEEDAKSGLYARLVSMTPKERMGALEKVLEDQSDQTDQSDV